MWSNRDRSGGQQIGGARWRLGQMLAAGDKAQGRRTDKATSSQAGKKLFGDLLKRLRLDKNRAVERHGAERRPVGGK